MKYDYAVVVYIDWRDLLGRQGSGFAFFNFTLAVRNYNHTGFMINLPLDSNSEISVDDVIEIHDRGGTHYTPGMRAYYLAIPIAFWLFGPLWLLAGTLLLIVALHRLDRGV